MDRQTERHTHDDSIYCDSIVSCSRNLVKFGRVVFEICEHRQSDMLIAILHTSISAEVVIVTFYLPAISSLRIREIKLCRRCDIADANKHQHQHH